MGAGDEQADWMGIAEAAEYLQVSEPTIFRWMRDGELSFYKVGRSTRFRKADLAERVRKTTGKREAAGVRRRCAACGHGVLVEGRIQGTGRLYFRPFKTKFWTLREAMVPTHAHTCAACGYVQMFADTKVLSELRPSSDED